MTEARLSPNSVVVATSHQSSADLGGETAILDLDGGIYYSVDRVGSRIWTLVQEPRTVTEICESLVARYDVTPERCFSDVSAFLTRLVEAGLVRVVAR